MRFYSFLTVLLRFSASKKKVSRLIWEAGKSCGQQTNTLLEVLSKSQARMGFMQPFPELIHSQHCRWPAPSRRAFPCCPQPPQWGKKWFLFAQNPRKVLEFNFASCFIIIWTFLKTGKETKNPWSMRRKAPGVCTATALFYFYFFLQLSSDNSLPLLTSFSALGSRSVLFLPGWKYQSKGSQKCNFPPFGQRCCWMWVPCAERLPAAALPANAGWQLNSWLQTNKFSPVQKWQQWDWPLGIGSLNLVNRACYAEVIVCLAGIAP